MSVARTAFSLARRVPFKAARVAPRTFTTVTARRTSNPPYEVDMQEKARFLLEKEMADTSYCRREMGPETRREQGLDATI
jgi:hypothetical protein